MCLARLILLIPLLLLIGESAYPERPVDHLSDFAEVIPDIYQTKINNLLYELEKKTGVEIAVVTVESSHGEDPVVYGVKLFEKWGIGKKNKDNGILVINFIKDRYIRIEVGYGLEGIIPDGLAGEVRDKYYTPYLKKGDYGKGHWYGALALSEIIAKEYGVTLSVDEKLPKTSKHKARNNILTYSGLFWLWIIISSLFGWRHHRRRRIGGWILFGGGGFGGGIGGGGGFGGFGGGASGGAGAGGGY